MTLTCVLLLGLVGWAAAPPAETPPATALTEGKATTMPAKKIPVIFDTDIGDDIDDTWALVMLLRSPELDLKLVTTDYGNTVYRAKIVAKLLEKAGRTDVPVGVGIKQNDKEGGQAPWVSGYDLTKYPGKVHQDGVQAMIDLIMNSPEPITVVCVCPMPNIQAALKREPRIAQKARFIGMHGSLRRGYDGKNEVQAEWNVKADPAACRAGLSAAWDITITPLDTCGLVRLKGDKYAAIRDSNDPLVQTLVENYRIWCGKDPKRADKESSILFDTVAVYLAFSQDLLKMETLPVTVTDDGFTRIDEKGRKMRCAMEWKDLGAYEDFLVRRLLTGK
jgi:inosine-uridine nucleoside N-ribohydrolase